jgi:hypothetical protein
MTLCEYKSDVYDSLGDVAKMAEMVTKEEINGIGKIILENGYGNQVMVALAHRHHDLASNEVMLEQKEKDVRVSKPIESKNLPINAFPNIIFYGGNNNWYPIGYGIDEKIDAWNDEKFLKSIAAYLILNNLQDKLTLTLKSKDDEEKKDGVHFVEYNYQDTRTSVMHSTADKNAVKNAIKTTYGFNFGPEGQVEGYCFAQCIPNVDGRGGCIYKEHTKC